MARKHPVNLDIVNDVRRPDDIPAEAFIDQEKIAIAQERDRTTLGEEIPNEDDLALAGLLSQLGETDAEARVTAYKWDETKKVKARLFQKPLTEFIDTGLDDLARDYGTGTYYVNVWSKASGQMLTHRRVDLIAPKNIAVPVASNVPQPIGLQELLTILDRQQQSAFSMVKEIAHALGGAKPQAESLGVKDVVSLVSTLQGLAQTNRGGQSMREMVETIVAVKGLIGDSGEANEQSVLLEAVRQFGGPLAEAMKQSKVPNAAATANSPRISAPAGLPDKATESESPEMIYRLYLRMLVQQAQAGNEPENYANAVLDQVGEDQAKIFLEREDWLASLSKIEPSIANYPQWFALLRGHILALLTQEDAPPENDSVKPAS